MKVLSVLLIMSGFIFLFLVSASVTVDAIERQIERGAMEW